MHTLREGFGELFEAEALETSPPGRPSAAGGVDLPSGAMIGAIVRDDQVISPRGDTVVQAKDRVGGCRLGGGAQGREDVLVRLEYF